MHIIDICCVKRQINIEATVNNTEHEILFTYRTCKGVVINKSICIVNNLNNIYGTEYDFIVGNQVLTIPIELLDGDIVNFPSFQNNAINGIVHIINNINNNIKIMENGLTLANQIITEIKTKKCC